MRGPLTTLLALVMATAPAAVDEHVVAGEPDLQSLTNVGAGYLQQAHREGSQDDYRSWLSVCLDLPSGEALRTNCVTDLQRLAPQPSVLVSGFHLAGAQVPAAEVPWMLAVGDKVPAAVTRAVLQAVRKIHPGPLVLRGWNDETVIISIGPADADASPAADQGVLERVMAATDDHALRVLLGSRPTSPPAPAPAEALLVDLDLRSQDGKPPVPAAAMRCAGVTWTPDGLYLPGARLRRFPPRYPLQDQDTVAPPPPPPYQAEVVLPALSGHAVTVTLLICQASNELERDNLFTLGQRSRWLSAQVGRAGEVLVGLDNRWLLVPARVEGVQPLTLSPRAWHAVTVAAGDDGRLVRVVVDGRAAKDALPVENGAHAPPRRIDEPGACLLSFADPGNPRHLHGLVRRVIVHQGLLDHTAIAALHQGLAPAALPAPTAPAFALPLTGTGLPADGPPVLKPTNVDDF